MKRAMRKGILAVGGMLLLSTPVLGQLTFDHAEYLKPKTEGQKKDHHRVKGSVAFDRDKKALEFLDESKVLVISIPNDEITKMLYEIKLHLISSRREHFLTIQYTDTGGMGKFAVIHMYQGNAREIVAAAEAETGKKVELKEGGLYRGWPFR